MAEREDVAALAAALRDGEELAYDNIHADWARESIARAILASSWLAAHDERVRADERERLAGVDAEAVRIPRDPEGRAALARMAGLTEGEEAALNAWCAEQAREDDARRRRGLERSGNQRLGDASAWRQGQGGAG